MKKLLFLGCVLALVHSDVSAHSPRVSSAVSFGVFYSSLDPHGDWILIEHDVYAWRPGRVVHGWRPYTVGRWAWTDDGWFWVSAEPWGWATYHYGRWYYDEFHGWLWVPGYDWAPAWVEWRYGGDFVGWAPLGPYAVFSIHAGIHYTRHWSTPVHWWSFVDCGYIASPSIHRYVYRQEDNRRYVGRTRTSGNVRYVRDRIVTGGPARKDVERRGGIRIERMEVVDRDDRGESIVRDGDRGRIEVYRPRFEDRNSAATARPGRVRENDRPVALDTKQIDGRVRDANTPQVRSDAAERRVPQRAHTDRRPAMRRGEQRESAQPQRDVRKKESGTVHRTPERSGREQQREAVEQGRPQRGQIRTAPPERTERRQEPSTGGNKRETPLRGRGK